MQPVNAIRLAIYLPVFVFFLFPELWQIFPVPDSLPWPVFALFVVQLTFSSDPGYVIGLRFSVPSLESLLKDYYLLKETYLHKHPAPTAPAQS